VRILRKLAAKLKLALPEDVATYAVKSKLARQRAMPNFGNAGVVDGLLRGAEKRLRDRLGLLPAAERQAVQAAGLLQADFNSPDDLPPINSIDDVFKLHGLIGCEPIKKVLRKIRDEVEDCEKRHMTPVVSMNFLFVGKPGTGVRPSAQPPPHSRRVYAARSAASAVAATVFLAWPPAAACR
jgi:hypothetical protein